LELAGVLKRLPIDHVIYGIEGRSFEMGVGLSPEVDQAADRVVQMIIEDA
jgi:Ni,Fe-hydrogenase maturation factor